MLEKIIGVVKNTMGLNLQFSSTLLHLSKDYLKDFNSILAQTQTPSSPRPENPTPPEPPKPAPLLLAGRLNETASAAFALNNGSGKEMVINLLVQGELDGKHVWAEPKTLTLKSGENAVVGIKAKIDQSLEANRDYSGTVVAPGLSNQSIEFVVRRLPGEAPKKNAKGRKEA